MNCFFCSRKYTPKHLCASLLCYDILRRLFLDVLYDEQPKNGGELYVAVMKVIETNNLFEESYDISSTVNKYLEYFLNDYDVS